MVNLSYHRDTAMDCALVISSCDAFSDVWEAYFTFLHKYWPDCPYRIYLLTDKKIYSDSRVTTLALGEYGTGWAPRIIDGLKRIPEKYVLYVQEDYLLTG